MKSIVRFLISKVFIVNLLLMILVTAIVLFVLTHALDAYTHHGEKITVRPLVGRTLAEVDELVSNNKLQYVIGDSSYSADYPPGVVLAQNPKAGTQVKENRTIYLTINSAEAPKVAMPKLIDVSLRQAQSLLTSKGLVLGDITYKPSPYHMAKDENYVLQQMLGEDTIEVGSMVTKGSKINLVVSSGFTSGSQEVPWLIGLTIDEAMQMIPYSGFNVGAKVYDETIGTTTEDTTNAYIVKQIPEAGSMYNVGAPIDLFFSKDVPDSMSMEPSDSTLMPDEELPEE